MIAGAALAEVLPLSPLAGNVRVGVTVVSYDGRLWLGVEADADHVAPAAGIAEAIADALERTRRLKRRRRAVLERRRSSSGDPSQSPRVRHGARHALIGASGRRAFGRWRGKGETGGMSSPAAEAAADALQTDSDAEQSPEGYTVFAVFRKDPARPDDLDGHDVPRFVDELDGMIAIVEDEGVTLRGIYDVSGLRADADVMLWLHGADRRGPAVGAARAAPRPPVPRAAAHVERDGRAPRRRVQQARTCPASCAASSRRPGSRSTPSCAATSGTCCRDEERGAHARRARPQGRRVPRASSPTPSPSFALGDYEWLLPLEADELIDLVDLMRDLRATEARRHVREEVPFYTGRRIATAELVEVLQ